MNSGSSSLKYGIYTVDESGPHGVASWSARVAPDVDAASRAASGAVAQAVAGNLPIDAVGHRIVFGGPDDLPALVTPSLLGRLTRLSSCDPLHMPSALTCIAAARKALPAIPHVVCFDTMFFRNLPQLARALPIPTGEDPLLRRYGFHGLSYEYLRTAIGTALPSRSILAHLGSGASLAALRDGEPIETTMGFSPMGGVIMASRPGDIDPGLLLYLMEQRGLSIAALRSLLEQQSGLRALSGGEGDLRKLLERSDDDRAVIAVESFVRSVAQAIGGLATLLSGLDSLVFTGGIGEHLAPIRAAIARPLRHLGVEIDETKNAAGSSTISAASSGVAVHVIPTDENATIARLSYALLRGTGANT
ncbi:MAG TPA: hypothetical protein VNF68_15055 [Candidatus Baltobacteraceae bacterium]|nr:hypothetical protein [Candidatus Baltobacteraceae bacterium]